MIFWNVMCNLVSTKCSTGIFHLISSK
jgi:hypothetical protein